MKSPAYKQLFSHYIDLSLHTAARILKTYPASGATFVRLAKGLKKSEATRERHFNEGLEVPPLMIVSTTDVCNLTCKGCYSCALNQETEDELDDTRKAQILDEASELGVSIIMLAGGEPLLSQGWLDAMATHDEMVGLVFSNGTIFDAHQTEYFNAHRHIIPTLSIEGSAAQTDERRGAGVSAAVNNTMLTLKEAGIPFGISVTVTSENITTILCNDFVQEYVDKGCGLFIFVEYVPVEQGSEPLVLSNDDKARLSKFATQSAAVHPALFIPFPGDEEEFGGCLAAGRGFINMSTSGNLEPCPTKRIKEAKASCLASVFLTCIRLNMRYNLSSRLNRAKSLCAFKP